jgi:hypothetical protein
MSNLISYESKIGPVGKIQCFEDKVLVVHLTDLSTTEKQEEGVYTEYPSGRGCRQVL